MANTKKCKECGCHCSKCSSNDHDVHLHVEIENLKQRLVERDSHIVNMETNFLNEANKYPNGELGALQEELLTWQDKYKRLYEAHKRVQRVNQGLEDKLLKLVDTCETDKSTLTKDVATLSHKLAEANYTIKKLMEDNERYKNDVSLAIQFLQCKPGNFISQKVDSLPNEVQAKVSSYLQGKRKPEEKKSPPDVKSIKVPIPTFPPTAMVYSVPKSPNPVKKGLDAENPPVDIVSAAIMAKILEERERERANLKHCDTCTCSKHIKIIHHITQHSIGTQTPGELGRSAMTENITATNVKIVKQPEHIRNKVVPTYVHDTNQNIAKVQPNNFLTEFRVDSQRNLNQTVSGGTVTKINEVTKAVTKEVQQTSLNQTVGEGNVTTVNAVTKAIQQTESSLKQTVSEAKAITKPVTKVIKQTESPSCNQLDEASNVTKATKQTVSGDYNLNQSAVKSVVHHELCDMSSRAYESDQSSVLNTSNHSEPPRGPRYCSMRLQTGSRNILLDNTHSNVAPVLYTRHFEHQQGDERSQKMQNLSQNTKIGNSTVENRILEENRTTEKFQYRRVAEWVETNNRDGCSRDGWDANRERYAEMEKNVKRFLFGENEFMKTVELGKQKYLDYQGDVESTRTETDI